MYKHRIFFGKIVVLCQLVALTGFTACSAKKEPPTTDNQLESVVVTGIRASLGEEYSWNVWLGKSGKLQEVTKLEADKEYTAWLDLSRISYSSNGSVRTSKEFEKELNSLTESQADFVIRTFALDDDIIIESQAVRIPVDLTKLKQLQASEEQISEIRKSIQPESVNATLSEKWSAGKVAINFLTARGATGCPSFLITVWNSSGSTPLDFLIVNAPIGAAELDGCPEKRRGGFKTLLNLFPAEPGIKVRTTLALIDFTRGDRSETAAVLVDVPSSSDAAIGNSFVWFPTTQMSDYIRSNIVADVKEARKSGNYSYVAKTLMQRLFRTGDKASRDIGLQAEKYFGDTYKQKASNEDWFAFYQMGSQTPFFIPLSILGVNGGPLGHSPNFYYPLGVARASNKCIKKWTIIAPSFLHENIETKVSLPEVTALKRVDSIERLENFFDEKRGEETEPEGFIILAHYHDGDFWFDKPQRKFGTNQMWREFANGSAAVVLACNAVNDAGREGLVKALRTSNIGTIVASPFDVRSDYGIDLANKLIDELLALEKSGGRKKVSSIFRSATERISDKSGEMYGAQQVEFITLGNLQLEACPAP